MLLLELLGLGEVIGADEAHRQHGLAVTDPYHHLHREKICQLEIFFNVFYCHKHTYSYVVERGKGVTIFFLNIQIYIYVLYIVVTLDI